MHKVQIRLGLVTLALAIGFTMAAYAADDKKDEVSLAQLPDAAQSTVNNQTAGGKIETINKETEDGKLQYEVKFTKGDKKMEINVAPDGNVLAIEEEVVISQVPVAVQKTITDQAGAGTVKKIAKVTEAGKDHFEVVVVNKDKKQWLNIATDGTVMPKEKDETEKEHKGHGEDKD
ncbi:MAG TPA: hypothetical protein VKV04_06320 [Verrucomicrobiae bacterium]|nr:hypothetical protein [Verrucomicrobiae bacterium]